MTSRSFLSALCMLVPAAVMAQPATGHASSERSVFEHWIFGDLWRSAGVVSDSSNDHIEGSLRPILPPFVVADLRAVRHPRGPLIAGQLAREAGIVLFDTPEGTTTLSSDSLVRLASSSPNIFVDREAYLRCRLIDLLIGDWSRSPDDIRWLAVDGTAHLRPVVTPYRNPFVRFDGLVPRLVLAASETMTGFEEEYPPAGRATLLLRYLDRRLLGSVSRESWDSTTIDLQRRLQTIDLSSLGNGIPPEPRLSEMLHSRIAHVRAASEALRRLLFRSALLQGTDGDDSVHIQVQQGHLVAVTLAPRGSIHPAADLLFNSAATEKVRILLGDGDDVVTIVGTGPRIPILIAGVHMPTVLTKTARDLTWRTATPSFISWMTNAPAPPIPTTQDWGTVTRFEPWLDLDSDDGLFVGGGPVSTSYGFQATPYVSQGSALAGIASATGGVRVQLSYDTRQRWAGMGIRAGTRFAQADVIKFFGMGNASLASATLLDRGDYEGRRRNLQFSAGMDLHVAREWTAGVTAAVTSDALDAIGGTVIDSLLSHGLTRSLNYGTISVSMVHDSRNDALLPVDASYVSTSLAVSPAFLQNRTRFSRADDLVQGFAIFHA
ncbi:MAG: hypothetical protein AABY75_04765, partial [Bacteroidota bacterium]